MDVQMRDYFQFKTQGRGNGVEGRGRVIRVLNTKYAQISQLGMK